MSDQKNIDLDFQYSSFDSTYPSTLAEQLKRPYQIIVVKDNTTNFYKANTENALLLEYVKYNGVILDLPAFIGNNLPKTMTNQIANIFSSKKPDPNLNEKDLENNKQLLEAYENWKLYHKEVNDLKKKINQMPTNWRLVTSFKPFENFEEFPRAPELKKGGNPKKRRRNTKRSNVGKRKTIKRKTK